MRSLKKFLFFMASACMLFAVGATMSACGNKVGAIKEETLLYDGTKITWAAAKNADKYVVTVNEKTYTTPNTYFSFSQGINLDSVTVSVYGVNEDEKEGKEASRIFTRLDPIAKSDITFDEMGVMSWAETLNADSYVISMKANGENAEEVVVADTSYSDFVTNKQLSIKIRPTTSDGLTYSKYTEITKKKTYLAAPTNLKYDGMELRWQGFPSAYGYEIYINGGKDGEATQNATTYTFDAENQTFSASMIALGGSSSYEDVYSSMMSEEKEFIFLDVINDLRIEEGKACWTGISEAEGYSIEVNDVPTEITATEYELPTGIDLRIRVKPLTSGEVYFSAYSVVKSGFVLEAPVLKWNESASLEDGEAHNAISWNEVKSATGYQVQIITPSGANDGGSYGPNQRNVEHSFTQTGGTYKIRVQATSDDEDTCNSKYSAEIIVERLPAPTLKARDAIVSDPWDNSHFTVTWNRVTTATGYKIFKNGAEVVGVEIADHTATVNSPIPDGTAANTEQVYMIQTCGTRGVEALANGVQRVRLSSVIPKEGNTADTCSFTISSKAMPTNLHCEGQYMLWEGSANTYAIKGIGGNQPAPVSVAQYDLYKLSAGAFQPSVCAEGDGAAVLASNYTETINVTRLAAPINIQISSYQADLPCLSWDDVTHAVGYKMTVNGGNQAMDVNSGDAIAAEHITTKGVSVGITAVGNIKEDNVYYVTSQESPVKSFLKLATPIFNKQLVQNGELVWNPPSNAQEVNNAFTYAIYNGSRRLVKNNLTSARIKLSELDTDAGEYVYYVKCIGDPNCINSEYSEEISFTILPAPTLTRAATYYTWEPVANAKSYELTINGQLAKSIDHVDEPEEPDYYTYVPDKFTMPDTEYIVQIRAIGDDGYETVNSAPFEIKQHTTRLDVPRFKLSYKGETATPNVYSENGYMVATATAVDCAKGYEFTIAGSNSGEIDGLSWEKKSTSTGVFTATVRAIGGTFVNGEYYISSNFAEEQTIILHAKVQNIELSTSGKISWAWGGLKTPANGCVVTAYDVDGNVLATATITEGLRSYTVSTEIAKKIKRIEIVCLGGENTFQADLEVQSEVASQSF